MCDTTTIPAYTYCLVSNALKNMMPQKVCRNMKHNVRNAETEKQKKLFGSKILL